MNHEELKRRIGANITLQRKRLGMTQAELAQRLNYSDKAVSKWERGESVPDVLTLTMIAQQFSVTVNDLIYGSEEPGAAAQEPDATPEPILAEPEPSPRQKITVLSDRIRHNRKIIQGLVSILVWIVATAVYVLLDSFDVPNSWLAFLLAVPVHAITLLSLRSAWRMFNWNLTLVSVVMWSCLICLHAITYIASHVNIWRMFLMGVLGQVAIVLWFKLIKKPREEDNG